MFIGYSRTEECIAWIVDELTLWLLKEIMRGSEMWDLGFCSTSLKLRPHGAIEIIIIIYYTNCLGFQYCLPGFGGYFFKYFILLHLPIHNQIDTTK